MSTRPAFTLPLRAAVRQAFRAPTKRCVSFYPRQQPILRPSVRFKLPIHQNQRRNDSSFPRDARRLFRTNPYSVTLASVTILVGVVALVYANWYYRNIIIGAYHDFPEPVAGKLRRAIYFSISDTQPKEALKYYRQALQVAEEVGMDPFSDEVMGIKIRVAAMLESVEQNGKAIQVLEILRSDISKFIDKYGSRDHNKIKRTRLLARSVQISVKLGELYGSPAIYDKEMAEERLVWAVETALKEKQRREANKISEEDEGRWIHDDELGASLEALAHNYEGNNQHYLATPLFLQALALHPPKPCHSVILMNNLASSLAQQSPSAARATQAKIVSRSINNAGAPVGPPASRERMIDNARIWAQKALEVAAGIRPPDRDEECDVGCAVATHNLGEFAEMQHNLTEARRRYEEAITLSRAIGFDEGVEQSSARLRKLKVA